MIFKAEIDVMPLKALLDPQGKTVSASLKNMGMPEIDNVKIGKHISLEIHAENKEDAMQKVEQACKLLLCNQIMEAYTYSITQM